MVEIMLIVAALVCELVLGALVYLIVTQFEAQRKEWQTERQQLLDRIQAGSFAEYKTQKRADEAKPKAPKPVDPLSKEPWA